MKKIVLLIIISIAFYNNVNAQVICNRIADEQTLTDIDRKAMGGEYKLAYNKFTSEEYLFKGLEESWIKAWKDLLFELNTFMTNKGIVFTSDVTCFNRIFFNKNGGIDIYEYATKGLDPKQEKRFDELIKEFASTHKVNYDATQPFWQYGNMVFEKKK